MTTEAWEELEHEQCFYCEWFNKLNKCDLEIRPYRDLSKGCNRYRFTKPEPHFTLKEVEK